MQLRNITFGPLAVEKPAYDWRHAQSVSLGRTQAQACNCRGTQLGQSKCPCMLRAESERGAAMIRDGVTINGRRYRLIPE
jgi:hypothetical protein